MVKMGMARNGNTSVHGTEICLGGRVLKLSRLIRELATLALLDKSIVAQTLGVFLVESQQVLPK